MRLGTGAVVLVTADVKLKSLSSNKECSPTCENAL